MISRRLVFRFLLTLAAILLVVSISVPFVSAERFRSRVETGLERVLHRNVEIGELRFSLWPGPGFTVRDVVIADLPEISAEPFAYVNEVQVGVGLPSLWRGELVFSSITLSQPSVNLAQGPNGGWNYEQMLRSGVGAGTRGEGEIPEVLVRNGRINFRSGLSKSIYYFRSADLRLAEEGRGTGAWLLEFRAEPARTDSYAPRFGTVRGRGRWRAGAGSNGQLDFDLEIERSPLAEIASLFRASGVGLSGFLAARAHLSGPAEALEIRGNLELSERGDWGLFTLPGESARLPLKGTADLPARRFHLEASPVADATVVAKPVAAPEPSPIAPEAQPASGNPEAPAASTAEAPAASLAVAPAPLFEASLDLNPEAAPGEWVARVGFAAMPVAQWIGFLRYLDASFPDYPELEGTLSGEAVYRNTAGLRGAVTGDRLVWRPPSGSPFALRGIAMKLEGERFEGRGLLDPAPVGQETPTGVATEANSADLPAFGFTMDRQSGGIVVSIEGRKFGPAHLEVLRQLAPVAQLWPPPMAEGRWQASGNLVWQRADYRDSGRWNGQVAVRGLSVPVPGVASPLLLLVAPLQIRGESWKITGAQARIGELSCRLDAAYDPGPSLAAPSSRRPLALSLAFDEISLAQLHKEVLFTEADSRGFLRRTFSLGARGTPSWLRNRSLVAKVYIQKVLIEDSKYYEVRGDVFWDGESLEARNISLRSRFGPLRAQVRANLGSPLPQWQWSMSGGNLPWNAGEIDVMSQGVATGNLESLLDQVRGTTEVTWRRTGGSESPHGSATRVTYRWAPGGNEVVICPQCVEFRAGPEVWLGGCGPGNGTTRHCLLEDPRTGQKHEINLPMSLFGVGAN